MNQELPLENVDAPSKGLKWVMAACAALLWIIALFLPAYSDGTPGIACFLFGWSMLFDGHTFAFLAWFGNLPFCIGFFIFLFASRKNVIRNAGILALIGFVFSFGALTITEIANGETGAVAQVDAVSGTYVWMLAHLVLLVGATFYFSKAKKN